MDGAQREDRAPGPVRPDLIVRRNQARDCLDVAALADRAGAAHAAAVLRDIDRYYADQRRPGAAGVATQLARQLADPRSADSRTVAELDHYKDPDSRWTDWAHVTDACRALAVGMVR